MAKITNTHKDPLGLPNGQVLESGRPTEVRDWDTLKENHVVKAWSRAGILTVEDAPPTTVDDEKEELIAKLAAFGVKADKRKTVEKLQAMLSEAEEALALQWAKVAMTAAIEASGLTAEAWSELPEAEREAQLAAEIEKIKAEAAQG